MSQKRSIFTSPAVGLEEVRAQLEERVSTILREEYGRAVEPGVPVRYYLDFTSDNRLQQLREALERMDNGTYGSCVICGRTIPRAVMMKSPLSLLCGSCRK